jgi:hypothetical protein
MMLGNMRQQGVQHAIAFCLHDGSGVLDSFQF